MLEMLSYWLAGSGDDKETEFKERTVLESMIKHNEHTFSCRISSEVRVR
jgi:hypothetical protein